MSLESDFSEAQREGNKGSSSCSGSSAGMIVSVAITTFLHPTVLGSSVVTAAMKIAARTSSVASAVSTAGSQRILEPF